MTIRERTFWVTGAASGIGRELVLRLAQAGGRITAVDRDAAGLARTLELAESPNVRSAVVDVTSSAQLDAAWNEAVAAFGPVHVCLNVAGFLHPSWIENASDVDVDRHIDVNVKGVMYGTRTAARHMLPLGSGHIINIASLAGIAGIPGIALYSASKFAVRGFSLAANQEFRPRGVAVTVVCPDAVQTPMLDLQRDYREAALTFSGSRALTAGEVCDVILGRVLNDRPAEVLVPRSRGILAKLAALMPGFAAVLEPVLRKKGEKQQGRR